MTSDYPCYVFNANCFRVADAQPSFIHLLTVIVVHVSGCWPKWLHFFNFFCPARQGRVSRLGSLPLPYPSHVQSFLALPFNLCAASYQSQSLSHNGLYLQSLPLFCLFPCFFHYSCYASVPAVAFDVEYWIFHRLLLDSPIQPIQLFSWIPSFVSLKSSCF